MALINIDIMMF